MRDDLNHLLHTLGFVIKNTGGTYIKKMASHDPFILGGMRKGIYLKNVLAFHFHSSFKLFFKFQVIL